ncbi:MAG TPA: response regulator [Verrucomicrobiae bacterium]|nr:response regulator [Verrucomicrobiae bacterium]
MNIKTILVVDDRLDDVELLKVMFRRSRILNPLHVVHTTLDAVCYLKGEGRFADRELYPFPALVLLDLHLPDGHGFDVLRWVHDHCRDAALAVVVLTGSDVHAIRQSYELGSHSFLTKPLKYEDFENMVRNVRGIKLTSMGYGSLLELEEPLQNMQARAGAPSLAS